MLRRIARDQVRLGMYIHALDGSWLSHPFWRRRFLLTDAGDLTKLLDSDVISLVIDEGRGALLDVPTPAPAGGPQVAVARLRPASRRAAPVVAERTCSYAEEQPRAARTLKRSGEAMKGLLDGVRLGRAVRSEDVADIVEDITASIKRNPRALLGLARLKSKDEYTYLHSVAVCALMANFARHLDLPADEVHDLAMAGLLHDVGKMTVPNTLLTKPSALSEEEFALVRTHPEQGYQLLKAGEGVPEAALDVCRHHHERIDGKGYPMRLAGDQISLRARMGAICDVYDALTSNRAYKEAWAPAEAVARMHEWTGQFDADLLVKFMRSIGVFPVGLLVRLRSNRLGVVLENGRRASRPRVRAFFSTVDRAMLPYADVAIDDDFANDQILGEEEPLRWGLTGWPELRAHILAGAERVH